MHNRESLFNYLKTNNIHTQTVDHDPVFTVEEAREKTGHLPGAHVKNLFLVDKRDEPWLVTCHEEQKVKVNGLSRMLGAPRFSFAKPDRLLASLGVLPGSVTPLALINDTERQVRFVLDKSLLDAELINVHPLENNATTSIAPKDLLRFVELLGYETSIIDLADSLTA